MTSASLNQLVGAGEEPRWHSIAKRLGGFHIDVQALRRQLDHEHVDPNQVAARSGEACNLTVCDWVVADIEDDRDRRGGCLGRERRENAPERGDAAVLPLPTIAQFDCWPSGIRGGVLALDIAGVLETLAESDPSGDWSDRR